MTMGDNGPFYRFQKLGSSQAFGPLKRLEV
jgi:hypothetical protein